MINGPGVYICSCSSSAAHTWQRVVALNCLCNVAANLLVACSYASVGHTVCDLNVWHGLALVSPPTGSSARLITVATSWFDSIHVCVATEPHRTSAHSCRQGSGHRNLQLFLLGQETPASCCHTRLLLVAVTVATPVQVRHTPLLLRLQGCMSS